MLIDHFIDEEIISGDEVDITSIQGTDENTLKLRRLELQDREKEREPTEVERVKDLREGTIDTVKN